MNTLSLANQQLNTLANRLVRPFFALALVAMVMIALLSDAVYDAGDGITYFEISRWSWKHPELFLHNSGNPFFTLLSSPFAQFGYKGIVIFNVLCHVLTAWVTWRIADRMKLPFAYLTGPLVIIAPISWAVAQSGLTEPLFALTLMSGIYFLTGGRNITAALLISMLPLARIEGFFLAPLFGLFFLIRREYLAMSLLASGSLLYSILGAIFVHHDFLWLVHNNPYAGVVNYGSGPLTHFADEREFIFGRALSLLSVLGLISVFFRNKISPPHSLAEMLLVYGSLLVFFVMHSLFWWKGLFGSQGLIRVMVCVIPCSVLIGIRGLQFLTRPYATIIPAVGLTLCTVLGFTVLDTFSQHDVLAQPDEQLISARQVVEEIRAKKLDSHFIYSGHPLIPYLLEIDKFDSTRTVEMLGIGEYPALREHSIVVWHSVFGPMQYNTTEEQLAGKPTLTEVIRVAPVISKDNPHYNHTWIVYESK
jgi:hypothetical protein